jgi:nucleoside-diphosphate-sugar epimerase
VLQRRRRSPVSCWSPRSQPGPFAAGRPRTEGDPDTPVGGYGQSKREGEIRRLETFGPVVTIPPPVVYGPRDAALAILFRMADRGFLPLPGGLGQRLSLVYARDLAQALVLAGSAPRPVRAYYVASGPPLTSGELADAIGRALGRKPLRFGVPSVMLRAAVACAEAWPGRRAARAPDAERLADWTEPDWTVDDTASRTELGYAPSQSIEAGIAETRPGIGAKDGSQGRPENSSRAAPRDARDAGASRVGAPPREPDPRMRPGCARLMRCWWATCL